LLTSTCPSPTARSATPRPGPDRLLRADPPHLVDGAARRERGIFGARTAGSTNASSTTTSAGCSSGATSTCPVRRVGHASAGSSGTADRPLPWIQWMIADDLADSGYEVVTARMASRRSNTFARFGRTSSSWTCCFRAWTDASSPITVARSRWCGDTDRRRLRCSRSRAARCFVRFSPTFANR
jgi:hypothetical protein